MLVLLKAVPGEIESDQMLDDRIIVQLQKVCKRPDYDNSFFYKKVLPGDITISTLKYTRWMHSFT